MESFAIFDRKREFCSRLVSGQTISDTQPRLNRFETALSQVYESRQALVKELANDSVPERREEFEAFAGSLKQGIEKAKMILQEDEDHEQLFDKSGDLIVRLSDAEQLLNTFKLLRETLESKKTLQNLFQSVEQEYKKMNLNTLHSHLSIMRKYFRQMVLALNGLMAADIPQESRIFTFVFELVSEWHTRLLELTSKTFTWSFDLVKWPLITHEDTCPGVIENNDFKFEVFYELFRFLLEIETGEFSNGSLTSLENFVQELDIFVKPSDTTFLLPLKLMSEPLTRRFAYHFMTSGSKLNNIENPEYALCQAEQWIKKNSPFLSRHTDQILAEYFGDSSRSSKYQLTCCLLESVILKLNQDLPLLVDSRLYSLTIEEVIVFNKQIVTHVPGIFDFQPELNPIQVFFPNLEKFERFSDLLLDRLNEFVEGIFESDVSWNVIDTSKNENSPLIVCEAADKFALLLQSLVEKSHFIPSTEFKLRILQLIVKFMDDFRLRLTQLIHNYSGWPFNQKFYSILNTFEFFVALNTEWQQNSYFIEICFSNGAGDMKMFQDLKRSYEHMIDEILQRIESVVMSAVSHDLVRYKRMNWHSYSLDPEQELEVSSAGANLIYNLSSKCAIVKKRVSSGLYNRFIADIGAQVEELLFDRVILEHSFNRDGARQFDYDVQYGLVPFFSMNTTFANFFKLSESLIILTCSAQTCRNLEDEFKRSHAGPEIRQSLKKIGIYSLNPQTVNDVIQRRIGFS